MKKLSNYPVEIGICIIFIMTQFLLLADGSIFWDDWVWFNNKAQLAIGVKELGLGPLGAFLQLLYNNSLGIYFSKTLIFVLILATGLIFKKILDEFPYFNKADKFFLTVFFLLAPVNVTKSSLCVGNNIFANFSFYLGSLLLMRSVDKAGTTKLFLKTSALILLFVSYFTNSFLVFTAVVYFAYFFKIKNERKDDFSLKLFLKELCIFLIIPIVFWIIKKKFFAPEGLYATYNEIGFRNFKFIITGLFKSFYYSYSRPFEVIFSIPYQITSAVFLIFLFIVLLRVWAIKKIPSLIKNLNFKFFILGIGAIMLAAFPYLVVKKFPEFGFHEGRHQLLMNLGYSYTLYYFIKFTTETRSGATRLYACCISLAVLVLINMSSNIRVHAMKHEQEAIKLEVETNLIFHENKIFHMLYRNKNHIYSYSPISSLYEYSGIFFEVFKEQTRLPFMLNEELYGMLNTSNEQRARFKISDTSSEETYVEVTISENEVLSRFDNIEMIYQSIFDRKSYLASLKNLLKFNYQTKRTSDLIGL